MQTTQTWIVISIIVLAVVALLIFILGKNRSENRLTPLASLAYVFVLAGLFFGDKREIGYGLLAIGVILAVIDMFNRSRHA